MLVFRRTVINRTRKILLVLLIAHAVIGVFMGNALQFAVPDQTQENFEQKIEAAGKRVRQEEFANEHLKHVNGMLTDMLLKRSKENWSMYHETVDVYESYSAIGLVLLVSFVFTGKKNNKTNQALNRTSLR